MNECTEWDFAELDYLVAYPCANNLSQVATIEEMYGYP